MTQCLANYVGIICSQEIFIIIKHYYHGKYYLRDKTVKL